MEKQYFITTDGFRKTCVHHHELRQTSHNREVEKSSKAQKQTVRHSNVLDKYKSSQRDGHTQKRLTSKNVDLVRCPIIRSQSASPIRSHSRIYNVRSPECAPQQMYLHENVRIYAKQNRPQTRRCKSADVAYRYGERISLPRFVEDNEFLTHDDLTMGQKQYIWGIARCYSLDHLKKTKQQRMQNLLHHEFRKRMITRDICDKTKVKLWKDYCDYSKVIEEVSENGCVRPRSSFSRRVLYGDSSGHVRPQISPLNTERGANKQKKKKIGTQNTDHDIETLNAEQNTPRIRLESVKHPRDGAPHPTASSSVSSYEEELVFAANEKLTLLEHLNAEEE